MKPANVPLPSPDRPQRGEDATVTFPPSGVVGLTKAQMAGALQISVRTLNGMMARGEIAYWRIGGRLVRFRVEDAVRRMNETVLVGGAKGVGQVAPAVNGRVERR